MTGKRKVREEKPTIKNARPRSRGSDPIARPASTDQPDFSDQILEVARSFEGRSFASQEERCEALVDRVIELVGGPLEDRSELREFLLILIETDPRLSEWK